MKQVVWLVLLLCTLCGTTPSWATPVEVVPWDTLATLDYKTGKMPESLKQLDGQVVEILGFIVPLELDDMIDTVKEFFLVPDPMACIHVPPPPPNQMIYVTMKKAIPLDIDFRGVALKGRLRFSTTEIEGGVASFELEGLSAKEADIEFEDPLMEFFEPY